ncbi:MAG: HD domain-containing phosphohydrolase [Planctomycetota bacterium]
MIEDKLLFVDDDPNLLKAYERQLRKVIRIHTAIGAEEALKLMADQGPFAVVVADLRMAGMSGIDFLSRVKEMAPETVRIMLTGHADAETAVRAVNEGNIFRFLTKPCPPETLARSLLAGLEQYRLVASEKRLLAETLNGAMKLFSEVMGMVDPVAFGRAMRITERVTMVAEALGVTGTWELEAAAIFSRVGYLTVPQELVARVDAGEPLTKEELKVLTRLPEAGEKLLASIPRLETVARAVRYHLKNFDGTGPPDDNVAGEQIPLAARVLRAVVDFEQLLGKGESEVTAIATMHDRPGVYDPKVLDGLFKAFGPAPTLRADEATIELNARLVDMANGDLVLSNVESADGAILIAAGCRVSHASLMRLKHYRELSNLKEPIRVMRKVRKG